MHKPHLYFHASSMQLAAHLDEHLVDMHFTTEDGATIHIACHTDAIVRIQKHIAQIVGECPEIALWGVPAKRSYVQCAASA